MILQVLNMYNMLRFFFFNPGNVRVPTPRNATENPQEIAGRTQGFSFTMILTTQNPCMVYLPTVHLP